jgi:hypothetical protein
MAAGLGFSTGFSGEREKQSACVPQLPLQCTCGGEPVSPASHV